ncbi:MAG: hypothetical protein IPM53_33570 [Anaerolineaceae bacterium]|nr:hypothetical protein [Anaerolineaceae bacterium]
MANRGSLLKSGDYLQAGDYLVSANGLFCAFLFEDGNLCIYNSPVPNASAFMWASGAQAALGPKCAYLFEDGNLCIYNSPTPDGNTFMWASGPQVASGPKCAYLHDDGNLCLYNSPTPDVSTYIWGSGSTLQAIGPSYEIDIAEAKRADLHWVHQDDASSRGTTFLANLFTAATNGGDKVEDVFREWAALVQEAQSAHPLIGSVLSAGSASMGSAALAMARQGKLLPYLKQMARGGASAAQETAVSARGNAMALRQAAIDAREAATRAGTQEAADVADTAEATAAEAEAEAGLAEAAASEIVTLSATGVGAIIVGVAALTMAALLPFMEEDQQQVHIIVNDSPYELNFAPTRHLYNHHGKTISLPAGHDPIATIPGRQADGTVAMTVFGFKKDDAALYGCEGAYQLTANPTVANGAAALPNGLKCFYYQPLNGNNGIAANVLSDANLRDFWAMYEREDSRLVDATYNNAVGLAVYAGLNSHDGGSGKTVIYIKG